MNNSIYDTKIIYFAGADSTSQSRLVQELQKRFNNETLLSFYGFQDKEPDKFIKEATDKIVSFLADTKEIIFIGQSYGGYFANYFAEGNLDKIAYPAFLINPMIFPENSIRFKNKELIASTDLSPLFKAIYLSEKDEVVFPQPTRVFFSKTQATRQLFTLENETHRINNLNPILNHISHYYNNLQEY